MKFWDASAIEPLLVVETQTGNCSRLQGRILSCWWRRSEVECNSASARRESDGALNPRAMAPALRRLQQTYRRWHEIDLSDAIREAAIRFLRVHPLRAADALQLAATFVAAERRPPSLEMVTLDECLANAACREGFVIVDLANSETAPE
jgi:predicted nucleic acid-binding protein